MILFTTGRHIYITPTEPTENIAFSTAGSFFVTCGGSRFGPGLLLLVVVFHNCEQKNLQAAHASGERCRTMQKKTTQNSAKK